MSTNDFLHRERMFDDIIQKSIPYVIFPPEKDKLEISSKIDMLFDYFQRSQWNEFDILCKDIYFIINTSRYTIGVETKIESFKGHYLNLKENILRLTQQIAELKANQCIPPNSQYPTAITPDILDNENKRRPRIKEKCNCGGGLQQRGGGELKDGGMIYICNNDACQKQYKFINGALLKCPTCKKPMQYISHKGSPQELKCNFCK